MAPRQEPLEEFDDPTPPAPEFDRDGIYALALPGLAKEERNAILQEARTLAVQGMAREAVANWICSKVARIVGGRSGFDAFDPQGKVIDPPEAKAAIVARNRKAGAKRQDKRNTAIAAWRARYQQLVGGGEDRKSIQERCYRAVIVRRS